ncbi:hypothetical protein PG984_015266 [Apiospora sp. TS-2023a]
MYHSTEMLKQNQNVGAAARRQNKPLMRQILKAILNATVGGFVGELVSELIESLCNFFNGM